MHQLPIGTRVRILGEYAEDWDNEIPVIVGVVLDKATRKLDYTVEDENGMRFDGWGDDDFLVVSASGKGEA